MKKVCLFIISLLLIIPFTVKAASPSVKSLEATSTGTTISYKGTMEDGSYAVMCKLYKGDEELDLLSSAVDNNNFEGSFTTTSSGEYKVYCANYEGGEVKKVEVTVEETEKTNNTSDTTSSNPKTYDAGIVNSVIILSICIAGIVGSTIYLKKKKKVRNN